MINLKHLKNKLLRLAYFFYSLTPVYLTVNAIRFFNKNISLYAHIFNTKLGKDVRVAGSILLLNSQIGDFTEISGDQLRLSVSKIRDTEIGKYCSIGENLITLPYSHFYKNASTYYFSRAGSYTLNKRIHIQNDVWIGSNVLILGGITIHNGAVIGAGSVVTKDIPPYAIAVGNPAKVIKYRFSKALIKKLEKSAWWNKSDLNGAIPYLDKPEKFLKALYKKK